MANIVITVDPNRERRSLFLSRLRDRIAPLPGLKESESTSGNFFALWAAAPTAPVSYKADDQGVAVIIGDAIPSPGPKRLNADDLRELWQETPGKIPEALDGFHIAALYRQSIGLVVGADPIGCFPVYYYSGKDFLLVGTSPELFRCHPDFQTHLDPQGLAGILLTNGIVSGRTVYNGIRRLEAGHLLAWKPLSSPSEILQYQIQFSDRYFGLKFEEQLEVMHEAMGQMIERQVTGNHSLSQLFSGGLDSRLLGGYLNKKAHRAIAVTFGRKADIEMKCAKTAARVLGFPHRMFQENTNLFENNALLEARWRCLSNGFSCLFDWQRPGQFETDRVLSGYALESLTGGAAIHWAYRPGDPKMCFDHFFEHINSWGIPRGSLEKLLKKNIFGEIVPQLIETIRQRYEKGSLEDFQKPAAYDLFHRQRFHTLSVAWIHSFRSWPILPGTDRRLNDIAAGMPFKTLDDRRAQKALLSRYFLPLAKLPLDRNNFNIRPLEPSSQNLLNTLYYKGFESFHKTLHPLRGERRYYYRLMDFNGLGWRAVRHRAEQSRSEALDFFEKHALDALLPRPEENLSVQDGITDGSCARLLTGFLLWRGMIK